MASPGQRHDDHPLRGRHRRNKHHLGSDGGRRRGRICRHRPGAQGGQRQGNRVVVKQYLLGLDAGHTVIKAAVFDDIGTEIGRGERATATFSLHPHWQERDMDVVWTSAAGAISDALDAAGITGTEVAGIGIGAHGDGLYLVDADLRPVRAAILATDTRAASYCERWNTGEVADALLRITGQVPAAYAPPATLSWLRDNEPEVFARAAHMLF